MFFSSSTLVSLTLLLAPLAQAAIHNVVVGNKDGGQIFTPEAIAAAAGDQVIFTFQQKNHSLTQSSFETPCSKKEGGVESGFMAVAANATSDFPTYTVTVQNTDAMWLMCNQGADTANSHCGNGMVFAINCGPDGAANSFTNFKNSALAVGTKLKAAAAAQPPAAAGGGAYGGGAYGGGAYGGSPPAASATPPATPPAAAAGAVTTHKVVVGGPGKLVYEPASVKANPGDVVLFEFRQKNHTVTQSSFSTPCQKLSTGFNSGYFPVATSATTFPTWALTVNDTAPIWAYCAQAGHCRSGMVFAINSADSTDKSYDAFSALAKSSPADAPADAGSANNSSSTPNTASNAVGGNGNGSPMGASPSVGVLLTLVGAVFSFLL